MTVLLTCAGSRVDIVRAFQTALVDGPHTVRVLISDAGEASPTRFAADGVVELPLVDDPSPAVRGAAVWAARRLMTAEAFMQLKNENAGSESDPGVIDEWACPD